MKILVIEDNIKISHNISCILEKDNYLVDVALDGEVGFNKALVNPYDLIILDLMLPILDGFEILEGLRSNNINNPILVLSAKNQVEDKVKALDIGADDYLAKPFASAELLARVRSILRRRYDIFSANIEIGDLVINTKVREVFRNQKQIELTPKEYELLEFLAYNKDSVVSRITLGEHIWGDELDLFTMSNFIDVHIKNLRKKIDEGAEHRLIHTKRGIGFMLYNKSTESIM